MNSRHLLALLWAALICSFILTQAQKVAPNGLPAGTALVLAGIFLVITAICLIVAIKSGNKEKKTSETPQAIKKTCRAVVYSGGVAVEHYSNITYWDRGRGYWLLVFANGARTLVSGEVIISEEPVDGTLPTDRQTVNA